MTGTCTLAGLREIEVPDCTIIASWPNKDILVALARSAQLAKENPDTLLPDPGFTSQAGGDGHGTSHGTNFLKWNKRSDGGFERPSPVGWASMVRKCG